MENESSYALNLNKRAVHMRMAALMSANPQVLDAGYACRYLAASERGHDERRIGTRNAGKR